MSIATVNRQHQSSAAVPGSVKGQNCGTGKFRGQGIAKGFTHARENSDENDSAGPTLAFALLEDAVSHRATDIHVDPCGDHYRVRFRIDGALVGAVAGDALEGQRLINQFKVLSHVDANAVDVRESRWSGTVGDQPLDLRCTMVPTIEGEKLCVRLFSRSSANLKLDELILCDRKRDKVDDWLQEGTGMMVVVGPTGSGKTTLLYALMNELDTPDRSLVTLEDPVERRSPNITQIEVHDPQHELDFADAVKVSLRLDPDYLMIGETRDLETASAAVAVANLGRAMLTSMHGEDLGSVIESLRNWGVTDREISAALQCVIATRLVRRLCKSCMITTKISDCGRKWLEANDEHGWTETPQSQGCSECNGTGFHGRVAIHRVWRLRTDDRAKISNGEPGDAIAPADEPFCQQGIELLRSGETSVDELRRAGFPQH